MSKLDELIRELCPDGVEYKKLVDAVLIERGKRVVRSQLSISGKYPVYQNSLTPLGYHTDYNYNANTTFIIVAGAAGEIGFSDKAFWAADDCFAVVCPENVLNRYIYHLLLNNQNQLISKVRKASIPRLSRSAIENLVIPIPPLDVQREIVRILDNFTNLTAELTTELTTELIARKTQYSFYREKLLDKTEMKVLMVEIADLGKWSGGKTPSMAEKKYWESGTIPWVSSKDVKRPILSDTIDHITNAAVDEASMTVYPAGSVAIVTRSGILRHTFPVTYIPFETTVNQDIKILVTKEGISSRYVSHVLQAYGENIRRTTKKQGGTVDSLDFQKVLAYKIPVPPLDVQNRIVNVLDNFEKIRSDLNIGLPAEIEARQKQYEYYRDKLLTFAENGNTILSRAEQSRALIKLLQYVFGYAMLPLSEIANVFRGEYITKKNEKAGNVPVILGGQEPAYYIDRANHTGEIVAVARSGASAGFVSYWDEPIFITDGFGYEVKKEVAIPKYLYYVLKNKEIELNGMKRGAGVPHVSGERLGEINLPVPPIEEQKRVVSILDRFDAICNDLTSGLPAEIEARQKQYEYYRDKLLTFKERG